MNFNKGGINIIVIIIAVALLFFITAGVIGGYFVWKAYIPEEETEQLKNGPIIPENIIRDEQGFINCGESIHNEKSFDTPFFGINFNEDAAFSCMGRNYKNNCSKAKLVISIDNMGVTYKFLESGSNCYARMEAENTSTGNVEWVQCPISDLVSFVNDQTKTVSVFGDLKEKMDSGDGDFGATIFTLLALVMSGNVGSIESFNCQTNF